MIAFGLQVSGYWASIEDRRWRARFRVQPDLLFGLEFDEDPIAVVEIQSSDIAIEEIKRRTIAYHEIGVPVLWCVPMSAFWERRAVMTSWQTYLHTMYYGQLWVWTGGEGGGEMVTPFRLRQQTNGRMARCCVEGEATQVQELSTEIRDQFDSRRASIPICRLWTRPFQPTRWPHWAK
jgi:hypothetical protein